MGHALPIIGHRRGKILLRQRVNVLRRQLDVDDAVPQHVHTLDEDVHMPTEDVQVSTQHVHVPAEDDGMTAEHVERLAEEKMPGDAVGRLWQEKPVHARQRTPCLLHYSPKKPTPPHPRQLYAAAL